MTMTDDNVRAFHEHSVSLTDRWEFAVSGPLFDRPCVVNSLLEAHQAVLNAERASALQKKAEVAMSVAALDSNGHPCVVRGVHSGHGTLTGVPRGIDVVYPQAAFIREALQKRAALQEETTKLNTKLHPYGVRVSRTYGRIKPEDYEKIVNEFMVEFTRKAASAKAFTS